MELSEFETQILQDKNPNDVSMTDVLDGFILSSNVQTFQRPDLSLLIEECGQLLFQNNEFTNEFNNNKDVSAVFKNFTKYKEDLDNHALKITENKQIYISGKKNLATRIRSTNETLNTLDTTTINDENLTNVKECVKELITEFKSAYDNILQSTKYVEVCFLDSYKYLRHFSDPNTILNSNIEYLQKLQLNFTEINTQFDTAEKLIQQSNNPSSSFSNSNVVKSVLNSMTNNDKLNQLEEEHKLLTEQNETYKNIILKLENESNNLKLTYIKDMKLYDTNIRQQYDQMAMKNQAVFDKVLADKDVEISSLLSSLNDNNQYIIEYKEKEKMIEFEYSKRNQLEQSIKEIKQELSSLQEQNHELITSTNKYQNEKNEISALYNTELEKNNFLNNTMNELNLKVKEMESELSSRPPLNLIEFASKIGLFLNTSTSSSSSLYSSKSTYNEKLNWIEVEKLLFEYIRKINAEATDIRSQNTNTLKLYESIQEEMVLLKGRLNEKEDLISVLENDLIMMKKQKSLNSNTNMNKLKKSVATSSSSNGSNTADNRDNSGKIVPMSPGSDTLFDPFHLPSHAPAQQQSSGTGSGAAAGGQTTNSTTTAAADYDGGLASILENENWSEINIHDSDTNNNKHRNYSVATSSTTSQSHSSNNNNNNNNNKMLSVVQEQRDKFMKSAQSKDHEIGILRSRLESTKGDYMKLQNENVELFRRLRAIRMGHTAGINNNNNINDISMNNSDNVPLRNRNTTNHNTNNKYSKDHSGQ